MACLGNGVPVPEPGLYRRYDSCRLTIEEVDDRGFARAEGIFTNRDGKMVLEATLTGFIPGAREREVITEMMTEGDPTNKLRGD
jgi:hypothetical protein